jgi:hypothetical protein
MGEFDLASRCSAPSRGGAPGIIHMNTASDCCVYPCDLTSDASDSTGSGHTDCGTCVTCGPGSPCAC